MADVTEHFREWHIGHDGDIRTALQLIQNGATTTVDVADHIAQVVARGDGLDLHHRL